MFKDRIDGQITTALSAVDVTSTSSEIDCTGYNAVLLDITITGTGTWTVGLTGSLVSGGTFKDIYDGSTQLSKASITANQILIFKYIPDFIKVVATETSNGATCTVKVQPFNI